MHLPRCFLHWRVTLTSLMLAIPYDALAEGEPGNDSMQVALVTLAAIVLGSVFLTKIWLGVVDCTWLHLRAPSKHRTPMIPYSAILFTVFSTAVIITLAVRSGGVIAPFTGEGGVTRAIAFFGIAALLWIVAEFRYPAAREYAFAFGMGTLLTFAMLAFQHSVLGARSGGNPYGMALGIVCIALSWRMLFGPWGVHIKATILGTFIALMAWHLLWKIAPAERTAHYIAIAAAAVPAAIWCVLFLREHAQRISLVLLMFFAGMLSTVPILFYDRLVRSGAEFQFFLFRIVPESFSRSSSAFVEGSLSGAPLRMTLISTLVSFLIVGLIEEVSKCWVAYRSGRHVVRSVDDVMQLAVIVAIGFAFAENILNPSYFPAFVSQHLLQPESPQWGAFIGNVVGRSILTSMVHILSTGVMGYFMGLAIFAGPVVRDVEQKGREYVIAYALSALLRLPEKTVFRAQMYITGIALATVLHGAFNFTVTLPELLPHHPNSVGDILGLGGNSLLHSIPFLLVPSLFYVVGGFWILTTLFARSESEKERGVLVTTDTFVRETAAA